MHMELQYSDLEERYRTRVLHAQQAEDQQLYSTELEGAMMVRQQWAALQAEAERVDAELEDIKFQFSHITKQQVSQLAPPDVRSGRPATPSWAVRWCHVQHMSVLAAPRVLLQLARSACP